MKAIMLLGTIAILAVVLFVAFDPASVEMREDRAAYARQQAQLDLQREQLRLEQERTRATVLEPASIAGQVLVSGVLIVALAGLVAIAGHAYYRRSKLVYPDRSGALPVPYTDAVAGRLNDVAVELAAMRRAVELATAQRQNVPHNYAPHLTYSYEPKLSGAVAPAQLDAVAPSLVLPGLTDLASISHTPNIKSILLGLAPGNELITVPVSKLVHIALCGATGGGKSNLMRLILPQLQSIGARVCLADPHFTPFDADSGDDWKPIAKRLYMPPAHKPTDIDSLLDFLIEQLAKRLELREQGQHPGTPLFLALDELPVITDSVPDAVERLSKILREGRKVGLFVVGASQDFLVKTLGGSSGVRDCYRTAFYVGGDLVSASKLLDMPQRDIDDARLETGLAYLRSEATRPAQIVRIPLASNNAVYRLLGDSQPTMERASGYHNADDAVASGSHNGSQMVASDDQATTAAECDKPTSLEAARAARLFLAGKAPAEIVFELRGVSSKEGRRYQQALDEINSLMRDGMPFAVAEQQKAA